MKALIVVSIFVSLVSENVMARNWDRVRIPGAYCGDGLPYSVFVDKKSKSKNLLIEFMGGGACWDSGTCYGIDAKGSNLKTWMHPIPELPFFSYVTSDLLSWKDHPFSKDSALYLPYCTGDVYSADHTADYGKLKARHQGYRNVVLTFKYLAEKNILKFSEVQRLTVYGASAGAIGALVHLNTIEPYFKTTEKLAIIDSAGLHFGPTFWKKFTPQLLQDFTASFARLGLVIDPNDGFVAKNMGPVFENLKNWQLGFLQSTRDLVMSEVFGEIKPEDHRRLVLSDQGLASIAKNYSNTKVWISESEQHTFLLLKSTSQQEDLENQSAIKFINDLALKKVQ